MFKKEQSISIRLWHWANAATIFLLFATVILRKTFLGKENVNIIIIKGQELGITLSKTEANDIARAIRNQMWQWHPVIGFVAIGLLAFRFFTYFQNRSKSVDLSVKALHYKVVKKIHVLFYFFLTIMGITGSAMYWDEGLHLNIETVNNIQYIHEALQWFFVGFIVFHIAGVIKAEFGEDKGIISDMINGGK